MSLIDKVVEGEVVTADDQLLELLQQGDTYIDGAFPAEMYKLIDGAPVELVPGDIPATNKYPTAEQQIDATLVDVKTSGIATQAILPPMYLWTKDDAKNAIDQAAGRARVRAVSQGHLVDMEYQLAERQVKEWRAASSPENDVPQSLSVWATASGLTVEMAAQNIESTALQWQAALLGIRSLRLLGKAAVDAEQVDFTTTANNYINQLNAVGT
ncbi:hypothetical protein [uncultured Paraglaciecola sp.]|uniref:hypothetical protein n=1 Tax=uncultured Paraglaciecola sp. TaxID=1765024 RepID=UPI00262A5236|nr:hypothetical protein [uncultured Paraglaciecola sp.]